MSFGHFLQGVASGLEGGFAAGESMSAAWDKKRVRDAGKKAAKVAPKPTTGAAPTLSGATMGATQDAMNSIPAQNRANIANIQAPSLVAGSQPPTTSANPMPAPRQRPVALPAAPEGYEPPVAANLGVQPQVQYDARFPAGIAGTYGVMGGPPGYQQYPYQQY